MTLTCVAGKHDFFNPADFHAGHFDAVADLQILHGGKQGIEPVTAAEGFHAAERFRDEPTGKHGENDKIAEPGFQ